MRELVGLGSTRTIFQVGMEPAPQVRPASGQMGRPPGWIAFFGGLRSAGKPATANANRFRG